MKKLIEKIKYILIVPDTFDPDDLRRRRVLNAILFFLIFMILLMGITEFWNDNPAMLLQEFNYDMFMVLVSLSSGLVLSILLLILSRSNRMPRNLAAWIFVLGELLIIALSDTPYELTSGRSIFAWAIPITVSVVILPPASVFIVDLIVTVAFLFYAGWSWHYFQSYTLTEIYIVSFISWLGMTVANKAIRDARNESRKNAAILEGVAEGVIVLGPNNRMVLANQAALELIGSNMAKIGPMLESAEIGGRALSFRWSEVQGVGWVAIVRDISRQIEIDHAKDAILRVVSHEMRTPLASILGFAEILESQSIGMATEIRSNAQRMLKLVNDLLDVAQLQAGVLTIQKGNFSPAVLRSYILENFLKLAEEKGILLEVHHSPTLPEQVTGDVQRLEQVVSNLVENAIKFTERGGRVDVSLCAENAKEWQMIVRDTGIGILPECLSDIFEPFRRASDYARRKHQGIGLGLSIVKKIVQLSGGDISVKSIVGEGTTFTVTLPTELATS